MKYCRDCVCFDAEKKYCRAYRNPADANHTACLTPPIEGTRQQSYNVYPTKEKCIGCRNRCQERMVG